MKVLIYGYGFPFGASNIGFTGLVRGAGDEARALLHAGHSVVLVKSGLKQYDPGPSTITIDGRNVPLYDMPTWRTEFYEENIFSKKRSNCSYYEQILEKNSLYTDLTTRLESIIKKEDPDIILTQNINPLIVSLKTMGNKIPIVARFGNPATKAENHENVKTFFSGYSKHISLLLPKSTYIATSWSPIIGSAVPSCIVYPGIDSKIFTPHGPKISFGNKTTIFFASRRVEYKGLHHLISAFQNIQEQIPNLLLLVGGAGLEDEKHDHYVQEQMALVRREHLHSKIIFLPKLQPESVLPQIYRSVDIHAFPTLTDPNFVEGFGCVTIEAMCSGVPTVAYDAGPLPEIITHESTGLLVKEGNVEALGQALTRLLTDKQLHSTLVENGIAHAINFSVEKLKESIVSHMGKMI